MHDHRLTRRRFLVVSGGLVTLASCGGNDDRTTTPTGTRSRVQPTDPAVMQAETVRSRSGGRVVTRELTAAPMTLDLAGRRVDTWGYGAIPGALLRANVGDQLEVKVRNELPEATSIHWHGLALRNDMDGVNELTQPPIGAGGEFTYRFALAHPGSYWFHPHVGLQLDRGLYAPLIVDDPAEPGRYDVEHVIVLDDWLDGFGTDPEQVLRALQTSGHGDMQGMDHGNTPTTSMAPGMDHGSGSMGMNHPMTAPSGRGPRFVPIGVGAPDHDDDHSGPTAPAPPEPTPGAAMGQFRSAVLGGDAGDVAYALHLVNGRPPDDRATFDVPAGGRARLRIVNAGSDTAYRFAVGGHRLTVTHADGFPIEPVDVDALIIGMGERYDVTVTATSGAWPIVAEAEGKGAAAIAVLRTTDASATSAPPPAARPNELNGQLLEYRALRAAPEVRLDGDPEVTVDVDLVGDMATYQWAINGNRGGPIEIEQGRRVRLNLRNRSTMWHPVHLHGHTFALGPGGPRKDTVNVLPDETVALDFVADNPGQWMLHCHNTYHLEAGMAATVAYVR